MTQGADMTFQACGFLFLKRVVYEDPADYFDFKNKTWNKEELYLDLQNSNLPVGMILSPKGCLPVVVLPEVGCKGQRIVSLSEVMV